MKQRRQSVVTPTSTDAAPRSGPAFLLLAAGVHVALAAAALGVVWWAIGQAGGPQVGHGAWDAPVTEVSPVSTPSGLSWTTDRTEPIPEAEPPAEVDTETAVEQDAEWPEPKQWDVVTEETPLPPSDSAEQPNESEDLNPSEPEVLPRLVQLPVTRTAPSGSVETGQGDQQVVTASDVEAKSTEEPVFLTPGQADTPNAGVGTGADVDWAPPQTDEDQAALMTGQVKTEPSQPLLLVSENSPASEPDGEGAGPRTADHAAVSPSTEPPKANDFSTGAFFGMPAGRRTVYLIDASGSLIDTLPFAVKELRRAVSTLTPEQSFAVVFFEGDRIVEASPLGIQPGTLTNRDQTIAWLEPRLNNVRATGRTDAVAALAHGLSYEPDTVFLLSDGVTGLRDPDGDRRRLVSMIKRLQQQARLHTVQFIDPDPTAAPGQMGTLELLAALTGGEHRFVGIETVTPVPAPQP